MADLTDTAEAIQRAASAATYGGGGTAVASGAASYAGLTSDEWALLFAGIGALVALVGLAVSWRYKALHYRLALAKAQADPGA